MDNCLIVEGGSVTGLRTSRVTYMFPEPIAFAMLERKGRAFITAFETNPIEAMEMVGVKIEGAVENTTDASKFTNHSGGAIGSDTEWDNIGKEFGMTNNKHYWTETKTPNGNTEISQEDFQEGRFESAKAAKRNFGYQYNTMKDSRLIRNWSQVKNSDAIFAIGKIVRTGEKMFPNQANDDRIAQVPSVTGGTGYAVGMGINNNKPVFVFNQTKGSYDIGWYKWDVNVNDFVKIETPKLSKNFAGIGTREINDAGKKAIREAYTKTFNTVQETNVVEVENNNYPLEYRYNIPFKEELKKELKINDKVSANIDRYRFGVLEENMLPTAIDNAEGISATTKELHDKYKNTYGDMSSGNWANDNFDKEGSSKLIMKIQESLLQDYYNYLKSIGYDKSFFTKYTGEIPDFVKKNFESTQETVEEPPFSKSRESIQTKSIKQVLSDYDISFDSLPNEAKTRLTNNPELLNDSDFINALKC